MTYEFGPFSVDARERVLRRNGEFVTLTPKLFDILLVLVQNSEKVMSKNELMKLIWPDSVVEESNLARNISTLRKSLGDGEEYIETIPWHGYRFIAKVHQLIDERTAIDSIAVLPFTNESPDQTTEYLADGITEGLINKLSRLRNLKVMSRNSVFHYMSGYVKKGLPNAMDVGRKLGVQGVLIGRIRNLEGIIIVSLELIDASNNAQLWGGQYNREPSDILTMQESISRQIAEVLRIRLTSDDNVQLTKRQTENNEAYLLYLKGRFYWNKLTMDGVQKGIELFKEAIEKDPNYALAYIGLLDCYTYLNSPVEARNAAAKALEFDSTLGEAHASLGFFTFLYDWDWLNTEIHFKRAIDLNPNYAQAHHWYSIYLGHMGRHEEAIYEARIAQQLDPMSLLMNQTTGLVLCLARKYDQAIEELLKVIDMDKNYVAAHGTLGLVYARKGMCELALEEFEKVLSLSGGHPTVANNIRTITAYTYAVCDKMEKAKELVDEITAEPTTSAYLLATIYASLGENDRALDLLERACVQHDVQVVGLKVDPTFDRLRGTARFMELIARIGLSN